MHHAGGKASPKNTLSVLHRPYQLTAEDVQKPTCNGGLEMARLAIIKLLGNLGR